MNNNNYDESRVISKYPVIVIGAGLGGLGAACQLVLRGEKVLLLDLGKIRCSSK
jgi:succinate dehydrogenase/fumarate reductase flavoprotein subunit